MNVMNLLLTLGVSNLILGIMVFVSRDTTALIMLDIAEAASEWPRLGLI